MIDYLRLLRPHNCIIASVGMIIASYVAIGQSAFSFPFSLSITIGAIVVFLFTGAGNSLNDFFDYQVDAINHPNRPIPSGKVARNDAFALAVILFIPTFPLSLFINLESFLIVVLNTIIMISYEEHFKARGLIGNVQISWLVASIFLFGGFVLYEHSPEPVQKVAVLALLAFLATFGREIAKDIQDVKGDLHRRTVPVSLGMKKASTLASASFFVAVLFSPLPTIMGLFGWAYIMIIVFADILFLFAIASISRNPAKSSSLAKFAMVIALVAFFFGSYFSS